MTLSTTLWALAACFVAWKGRFFKLPKSSSSPRLHVTGKNLTTCFAIYLAISLIAAPLVAKLTLIYLGRLHLEIASLSITLLTALQFTSMLAIFLLLQTRVCRSDRQTYRRIWKDKELDKASSIELDLGLGALTWVISFPLVATLGNLLEKLLHTLFDTTNYEQMAVQFVKIASSSPLALTFALLCVILMAPLIEEFLFRGLLQTYLKGRLGPKAAILLSALLFALFHFSVSQGVSNISLIFSLFILGLFLGFLYERQRSLWAPLGLHMTFNIISALRILIGPEAPL